MIPIAQRVVERGAGDCMRAAIASLLEIPYEYVWNFSEASLRKKDWFYMLWDFLHAYGFDYHGTIWMDNPKTAREICEGPTYKGHAIVSVPSRTFEDVFHSVVSNANGLCVHDPNPNKKWQGVYLYLHMRDWWMIDRINP